MQFQVGCIGPFQGDCPLLYGAFLMQSSAIHNLKPSELITQIKSPRTTRPSPIHCSNRVSSADRRLLLTIHHRVHNCHFSAVQCIKNRVVARLLFPLINRIANLCRHYQSYILHSCMSNPPSIRPIVRLPGLLSVVSRVHFEDPGKCHPDEQGN